MYIFMYLWPKTRMHVLLMLKNAQKRLIITNKTRNNLNYAKTKCINSLRVFSSNQVATNIMKGVIKKSRHIYTRTIMLFHTAMCLKFYYFL